MQNVLQVVVNAEIYPELTTELAQYRTDLEAAGYTVRFDTTRTTSHQTLRTFLQRVIDLRGVLLVGELPVAWYEDDWGGSAPEEFPCDLYFADLNGTWVDRDGDGLYDDHTGNVAPEIWVGRLYARPLTWDDEVRLLKHYFHKNHLYRTGALVLPDRGLCFNDEDWAGSGNCGMTAIYPAVTVIEDSQTTAPNYRTELLNGYEWIHVMSHSSAWGHTFRSSGSDYTGTVFNCEIYALQPRCHFYDLFACSGARFIEENYSAGWDVFNDDWGLAAIGSTKTGSMIGYFEDFFSPLGAGASIGDAFKSWFIAHGELSRDWHYGLTIIGDPSLKPRHGTAGFRPSPQHPVLPEPALVFLTDAEIVGSHPETDAEPALISAPDGKLWAVWVSGRTPGNGRFDIYGAYRSPTGWSAAMPIGTAYYWEYNPALGIDNSDRPVCVWSLFENSYHYNLYYSYWNGASWSPAARISDDPSEDMKPALTRDSSGRLWCFWQSRRDYYGDIFACYWNGSSWSSPLNITPDQDDDLHPAAVTDASGRPWVIYTRSSPGQTQIWAKYWNGSQWLNSGPISGTQRRVARPASTVDGNRHLWVTWQGFDSGNGDVYASYYDGSVWSAPVTVSTSQALDVLPAMTCDALGKPWVVWQSRATGNWNIFAASYNGNEWTEPVVIDSNSGFNLNPRIVSAAAGSLWAVWQNYQTRSDWQIYAAEIPLTGIAETPRAISPSARDFLLCQPDPVSAQLRVRYCLSSGSESRLLLCDRAGRVISNLGVISGDGTLTLDLSGRNGLPAGIYFLRLESGAQLTAKFTVSR